MVARLEVGADFVNSAWDAVKSTSPGTEGDWCFAEGSFEGEPVNYGTETMLDAMMGEEPNPLEWEKKAGGPQSPIMTRECRKAEGLVFIGKNIGSTESYKEKTCLCPKPFASGTPKIDLFGWVLGAPRK